MPSRSPEKRLVRAAIELFGRKGYHGTGIADILKESGCTRGVLYYHFSSKEELGYAAIEEEMRLLFDRGWISHLKSDQHPIDRLLKAVDALPTVAGPGTVVSSVADISVRLALVHDGFRERLQEKLDTMVEQVEEMVRQGIVDGQIAGTVDPRVLTSVFVIMSGGIHVATLFHGREVVWESARRWLKEYLSSLRK